MKFSWDWILEHIKLDMSAHEGADLLSLHGLTVDEVIPFGDDFVLDVDITTNRPDAMNIRGLAREFSAITGVSLESLDLHYPEITTRVQDYASIDIQDARLCHRFCARVIKNTKNEPSPDWMKRRLEAVGMRSLGVNVDVTNYVLWELGHPLHGYDLKSIPEGKIIVRTAENGEQVKLLDDSTKKLDESDLVIADVNRAIGLAGVMGGHDTEIEPHTTDILLECAWFDPVAVRKTGKKLNIKTEASYRFERGMGHFNIPTVIDRACHLYHKLAGGEVCREMIDEFPTEPAPKIVTMNHERLCEFAGMEVSRDRAGTIFTNLGMQAEFRETFWRVTVPSRRVDITREADLFEEIIRIVGYDKFPATIPHVMAEIEEPDAMEELIEECHGAMLSAGFTEVINYDFIDPEDNAVFAPDGSGKAFSITNPIAAPQWTTMRQSLAPSFVNTIKHNANLGNTGLKLYEVASVFHREHGKPVEHGVLGLAMDAAEPATKWPYHGNMVDFFDIKGVIQTLFTRYGVSDIIYDTGEEAFLAPWASAKMLVQRNGSAGRYEKAGWFGQLTEQLQEQFGLPNPVFLGQIDLETLLAASRGKRSYMQLSRYPVASRDMSILIPAEHQGAIRYADIVKTVRAVELPELAGIELLDIYTGEKTQGATSMTIRLIYQSMERTLTVEEVEEMQARARKAVEELGISFR